MFSIEDDSDALLERIRQWASNQYLRYRIKVVASPTITSRDVVYIMKSPFLWDNGRQIVCCHPDLAAKLTELLKEES